MVKRFSKARIWVDVTCGNCGAMIGRFYNNTESISKIKNDTRLWRYDNVLGINLCEDCLTKLGGKEV